MQTSNRSHIEISLSEALDAFAKAEADLVTIEAGEAMAIRSAAAHADWRAKRDIALGELERCKKVAELRKREADEHSRVEAEAAFRQRYAEKIRDNRELAERIPKVIESAKVALLDVMREVAISQIEDLEINAALPADLEPLASADFAARGSPALPRQEISRERIWLWVRSDTNKIIGDQAAVADHGNGRGSLRTVASVFTCEARLFDKVKFNPPAPMERPASLFSMKLVNSGNPGFAFDGDLHGNNPRAVLAALDALSRATQRKRPVEFELVPVGGTLEVTEKTELGAA
jgi:hypothetical protein